MSAARRGFGVLHLDVGRTEPVLPNYKMLYTTLLRTLYLVVPTVARVKET